MIKTKEKKSLGLQAKRPNNLQGNDIKLKSEFVKARQFWRKHFLKALTKCESKILYLDKLSFSYQGYIKTVMKMRELKKCCIHKYN